jgi:hypothetical protein
MFGQEISLSGPFEASLKGLLPSDQDGILAEDYGMGGASAIDGESSLGLNPSPSLRMSWHFDVGVDNNGDSRGTAGGGVRRPSSSSSAGAGGNHSEAAPPPPRPLSRSGSVPRSVGGGVGGFRGHGLTLEGGGTDASSTGLDARAAAALREENRALREQVGGVHKNSLLSESIFTSCLLGFSSYWSPCRCNS